MAEKGIQGKEVRSAVYQIFSSWLLLLATGCILYPVSIISGFAGGNNSGNSIWADHFCCDNRAARLAYTVGNFHFRFASGFFRFLPVQCSRVARVSV